MNDESILCETRDGVLKITLNRPDKLNALTDTALHELQGAFAWAASDPAVRAVLLTGAGKGFCAGQDLAGVRQPGGGEPPQDGAPRGATNTPLTRGMTRFAKPIVAAINGAAAGAGMSLAMACDVRVAPRKKALFFGGFFGSGRVW